MKPLRVAILGGGVAGLSTAFFFLQKHPDANVQVFEATARTGGNIRTIERDGCLVELGPDAFLAHPEHAVALCRSLGMESMLDTPSEHAKQTLLAWKGRLVPLPEGLALGMPRHPMQLARTPILSLRGKIRALGDLFLPAQKAGPRSVGALVTERFGREVNDRLVAPLLGGIYGGDVHRLDAAVVMPQFAHVKGSLLRSLAKAPRPKGSVFRAPKRGMTALIERLETTLGAERLHKHKRAIGLQRVQDEWHVRFEDQSTHRCDVVVLALPAHEARVLMQTYAPAIAEQFAALTSNSSASVVLAFDRARVQLPRASGFLLPREAKSPLLAVTFIENKWPERVTSSTTTIRAVVGGAWGQSLVKEADEVLLSVVREQLHNYLTLPEERWSVVERHAQATPQPEVGHLERVAQLRSAMRATGPIFLAGAGYDGPGIVGCVRGAAAIASSA